MTQATWQPWIEIELDDSTPLVTKPGPEMTRAWLDYLMREREVLIIRLGSLEDVLIENGRLERRSITPRKKRY